MSSRTFALFFVSSALAACGGVPATAAPTTTPPRAEEAAPAPTDTIAVSGLRGTLSQHEIQGALAPRLPKFLRCVQARLGELEVLAGTISFAFSIATNGQVAGVRATSSTLGDREAERCMLEVAEATRFPPPHGGEAEFQWPLEVPLDPDVRAPVELPTERAQHALAGKGEALRARCGGGPVIVTAYLDSEGAVLAAGAASPDLATPAQLECIVEGVRALRFDSPGSYVGKLSFALP